MYCKGGEDMAEKTKRPIIEFKHVSKRYKLYSGNRQRLASVFVNEPVNARRVIL